ncbi:MAG: fatty acid--CoA ligase, partial [Comamonas sp.]
ADERWGQVVVAHVVRKAVADAADAAQLDAFLVHGDRLAAYKRPRRYHFVESLPKTTSGKIQKHLLRQPH